MNEPKFDSLQRVVKFAAIHSQQFRLSGYSSRGLSADDIEDIGIQLVNLYEMMFEQKLGGVGGGKPPNANAAAGGQRQRHSTKSGPYR